MFRLCVLGFFLSIEGVSLPKLAVKEESIPPFFSVFSVLR
jgi:hypothetical protein